MTSAGETSGRTSDEAPAVRVPRISTRRLLLREFRREDFDGYAAAVADPIAQRHLSGVVDRRTAWRMFGAATGFWMLHGAGWWAVELTSTHEVVGNVGAFFREGAPDIELGWVLYRRFWRQGYATEAAQAALGFAFDTHRAERVIAHIDHGNEPSIHVGARLGMKYEKDVDLFGTTTGRYVIQRGSR